VPSSPSMRSLYVLEMESSAGTTAINAAIPARSWSAVSPASNSPKPQGLYFIAIKVKSELCLPFRIWFWAGIRAALAPSLAFCMIV